MYNTILICKHSSLPPSRDERHCIGRRQLQTRWRWPLSHAPFISIAADVKIAVSAPSLASRPTTLEMPARRMPAQEQQRIVPDICISVKKDDSTLEYELTQMTQGYQNLEDFYLRVNNHVSLIMNRIKSMNYYTEITNAILAGQKDMAFNAIIRGLKGDTSRGLIIRKSWDVHEAYSI